MRTSLRLGALLLAGLAFTACTRVLDMEALQGAVGDSVGERFGLEVAGVECPESREAKPHDVFECLVTTAGGATIAVQVLQLEGGEVTLSSGETRGLLDREKLAADIRAGLLAQTGMDALVDCGSGFGDTAPGESFECEARGREQTATVVVTVQDRDGRVGWSLEGAPSS
jgi:hypothetical protein